MSLSPASLLVWGLRVPLLPVPCPCRPLRPAVPFLLPRPPSLAALVLPSPVRLPSPLPLCPRGLPVSGPPSVPRCPQASVPLSGHAGVGLSSRQHLRSPPRAGGSLSGMSGQRAQSTRGAGPWPPARVRAPSPRTPPAGPHKRSLSAWKVTRHEVGRHYVSEFKQDDQRARRHGAPSEHAPTPGHTCPPVPATSGGGSGSPLS